MTFLMTRRLPGMLLTAVLAISVTGCADSSGPGAGSPDASAASEPAVTAAVTESPDPAAETARSWKRPRYHFARVPRLTAADMHASAVAGFGSARVRAAYAVYGPWLVRTSVSEKTAVRNLEDLTRAQLESPLPRMAAAAASDWRAALAQPKEHADDIHALFYFGFPEAAPFRGGPVVVNTELRNPGVYGTTNGKLKLVATVYAELRSTKDGKPVRWPIERHHTLYLVPSGSSWLVDGWQTTWDYDDPAIPDA